MKIHSNVYMTLMVVMLFIQQIISGCATTVTNDLQKEDLFREDLHKKSLTEEELQKGEVDLFSQKLFQDKCSLCHDLPAVEAYSYTPEQWSIVIDNMHDTKESRKFITMEEEDKIKVFLGRRSQTR